jgi:hypothetical protein
LIIELSYLGTIHVAAVQAELDARHIPYPAKSGIRKLVQTLQGQLKEK